MSADVATCDRLQDVMCLDVQGAGQNERYVHGTSG